jgi:UDP-glucose 4-epimerase
VGAIISLAECEAAVGEVFNIGSTEEISINDLAHKVLDTIREHPIHFGREQELEAQIKHIPYDQAYAVGFEDMRRRVPDISKIQRFTGWQPTHTLDQVLADVVAQESKAVTP